MKKIQFNLVLASALTVFSMTQISHALVIKEHQVGMNSEDLEKMWVPSDEESQALKQPKQPKQKDEVRAPAMDKNAAQTQGKAAQGKQGAKQGKESAAQTLSSSTPIPVSTPVPVPTMIPVPLPSDLPVVLPTQVPQGKQEQTKQGKQGKTQVYKIELTESQNLKQKIEKDCGVDAVPVMDPSPVGLGIGAVAANPELRITFPFGTEVCGERVVSEFVDAKKSEHRTGHTPQSTDRKHPKDLGVSQGTSLEEVLNKQSSKVKKAD